MNAKSNERLRDIDPAWLRTVTAGIGWIIVALIGHLFIELTTGFRISRWPSVFAVAMGSFVMLPGIPVAVVGLIGGWMVTTPEPGSASGGKWWSVRVLARVLVTVAFLWVAVLVPLRLQLALPWNLFLVQDMGLALGLLAGAALAARLRRLTARLPAKALAVETRILGWVLGILAAVLIVPAIGSFQLSDDGWIRRRPWRLDDEFPPAGWALLIWMAVLAKRCRTALDKWREQGEVLLLIQEDDVRRTPLDRRQEQREAAAEKDSRLPRGRIHFGRIVVVTAISMALTGVLLGAVAWWSRQQIDRLTAQLQHADPELRKAVGRFYPYGRAAAGPFVAALLDEDPEVRQAVVIYGIPSYAGKAPVPHLLEMLRDPALRLRRWGALPPIDLVSSYESTPSFIVALQNLQNSQREESKLRGDPELLAALNEALEDEDVMVRYYASEVLGRRRELFEDGLKAGAKGERLEFWIGHLDHEDPQVRLWAAFHVGLGHDEAIPAFAELLHHEDWKVRLWSAKHLGLRKPPAIEAAPALVQALADEHAGVCRYAAWALNKFSRKGGIWEDPQLVEAAVPKLADILDDDTKNCAWSEAFCALSRIGPAAKDAVPALVRKLEHWDLEAEAILKRIGLEPAAEVMGLVDAGTEEPVPALVEVLTGGEGQDRLHAVLFLRMYGEKAEAAVPALVEALGENKLAGHAAGALVRIGPGAADALLPVARDRDSAARERAVSTLGEMSLVSDEMIEVLTGALQNGDDTLARAAAKALGGKNLRSSSPAAKEAMAALRQALDQDDQLLSVEAVSALRRQRPAKPEELVAVLIEALDHENAFFPAVRGLEEFGSQASSAVPALLEAAGKTLRRPHAQSAIVRALAMIGDQEASIKAAKMK